MTNTTFTNDTNIPLSLAVWLSYDDYDYNFDPNTLSATELLQPIRALILSKQNPSLKSKIDVSSLVPSAMGTALHSSIESVWLKKDQVKKSLINLGYPQATVDKVLINPEPSEITKDSIPVYLEQRKSKKLGKYTITGKSDFIINGALEDFKSSGTYSYLTQSNAEKHMQQGSIYRWLQPDIITSDVMHIRYLFTDWSKLESIKNPNYPKSRLTSQPFNLMGLAETEQFILNILNQLDQYISKPQDELPRCSDKDLWIKPTVWKYYKDPNKTNRSTKNFDNELDAYNRLSKDGSVGIVKKIEGKVERCKYCPVVNNCNQAKEYINSGQLTLNT